MNNEIPFQNAPLLPMGEPDETAETAGTPDGSDLRNGLVRSDGADPDQTAEIDEDDQLASDPFTDDLTSELAVAAGRRWGNRATVVLGGLALVVVGFLGGALVQKNYGTSSTAASDTTRRNGLPGAFSGGNFPRGTGTGNTGASAGSSQSGTIILVDGSTIYVKLATGDTVTVKTSADTKVSLTSSSKVSALKKGQQVTFTGQTDSATGTVTATSVTASK